MKTNKFHPLKAQLTVRQAIAQTQTTSPYIMALGSMVLILCHGGIASAQTKLEVAPEIFNWTEERNGMILVEEKGLRLGLELSSKQQKDTGWIAAGRAKIYFGEVDYVGQLQNGTPLETQTTYFGGLLEGRYGHRSDWGKQHYLDVMGGFGVELWQRSLGSQYGYDEYWMPFYYKLGVEICPKDKGFIGALGVKSPLYTRETVDLTALGGSTVDLNPGSKLSIYAEAGYQFTKSFSVAAFLDTYWFEQSPVSGGVYQPESKSLQVGIKFSWAF